MRVFAKALILLALLAVGLVAMLVARTLTYVPPGGTATPPAALAPAPAIDQAAAARRLSEAIRFRTISNQDPAQNDRSQWDGLHAWLAASYPAAHAAMTRETVAGHSLIYTWAGSEPGLKPILLMAHQDVVPVSEGTEKDWAHPPFAGTLADGAVWGRGAIDDKGSLVGLFEAVEALVASGFKPRRTILIVSGHDEEAGGSGAQAAAALLKARGVSAEFVLDEGLLTIRDFPVTDGPAALVGVAEKGYATLRLVARGAGGHSSMPPPETAVETLAKAVLAITAEADPPRLEGPGAETLRTLAPRAPFLTRLAVANEWLFRPLLLAKLTETNAGAALLRTTVAPTMLSGSPKENVLPQEASAAINFRILPGQSAEGLMARAKRTVGDLQVELGWIGTPNDPSPTSSTASPGWAVIAALASEEGRVPVAPGLVLAGTDSRYMTGIAADIYRYQPLVLGLDETGMIHGTNERMTLDNFARMTRFYARLMASAAR